MRGHHAYKDLFAPEIDKQLTLQREPETGKDRHAVALTEENGRIVGRVSETFHWGCQNQCGAF